jgi:hypothetical protein
MIRHLRAAALTAALMSVVATAFLSAGAPADAVTPSRSPKIHVHHHRRRAPHRLRRHWRRRPNLYGITPKMMEAAARVSRCEEGGDWDFAGTSFDGGIGWTPENWVHFRKPSWPRFMHNAPPRMQANALFRFVRYYGIGLPDQNGVCAGY